MAYPPAYTRAFSFTDWETLHPADPKPGDSLDTEFDNVSNALTATQDNLALIQRADGALANDSVGEDQLQDDVFDGIVDGITADAEAAADAAAASAVAAAGSASAAAASASAAAVSDANASGAAAQAGISQGIAQGAATQAEGFRDDADDAAVAASNAANEAQGFRNEGEGFQLLAFDWAEKLTGPVLPADPGWPEAVDDGMFSAKWWAIRAREYNATETIDLGTAGADIGEAFDIWDAIPGNDIGIGQVYATWGTPTQTYVLIDRANPSDPASWQNITGGPGPPGPANSLAIGTVTTGPPGSSALAAINGTPPSQTLNLTIPAGATGGVGPIGPAGPPNALSIGTVTSVPDGTPSNATITGTAPTQVLNLTLTAGPQGIQGIPGPVGPPGTAVNLGNPTAQIGLTAVNGASTNALRSDGAPALSQAIAPTWTGQHLFAGTYTPALATSGIFVGVRSAQASQLWVDSSAPADGRYWETMVSLGGTEWRLRTHNDAFSVNRAALVVNRSGVAITQLQFGNATDNPTYTFLGTGIVTAGGVFRGPSGVVGTPSYSFTADTDTGLYLNATGDMVFTAGGIAKFRVIDGSAMPVRMIVGQFGLQDGTAAAPAIAFEGDPDTGMYRPTTNFLGFTTGGVVALQIDASGNFYPRGVWYAPDGSATAPSLTFFNDSDTGMYLGGTNSVGFTTGGVLRLMLTPSFAISRVQHASIDGSAAAPAYSFENDLDTGIYRVGGDHIGFATGGVFRVGFHSTGAQFQYPITLADGSAVAPSLTFTNDTDTGFYRSGTGTVLFTSDSTLSLLMRAGATLFPDGTAAVPSISFLSDADTGMFRVGTNAIGIAAGGSLRAYIDTSITISRNAIYNQDGSAAAPAYTFEADSDSGMFRDGTNQVSIGVGGVRKVAFFTAGMQVDGTTYIPDGSVSSPSLTFTLDPDTGIYRGGSGITCFSSNGAQVAIIQASTCHFNANLQVNGQEMVVQRAGGALAEVKASISGTENISLVANNSPAPSGGLMPAGKYGIATAGGSPIDFSLAGTIAATIAAAGITASSFTSTSSRAIKRETGAPSRAADILSRLRPILYRLLADDSREQLGLIAEEVHEVCPLLSDGKTVSYDRLALLLLADWQESRAAA